MKKFMLVALVIVSMATGCTNEKVEKVDDPYFKEIEVKPIEVNEITFDNVEIQTWD